MDSKQEADNKPEPKVRKAKIKEDAQGDSQVVPSPADIARIYKENPQTEPVAQVDRVAAQSNFETATADELISSKTSPEQFPGTDYEDADYDLPTGSSPFVDGRKINIDDELLPRPKKTVPASSDHSDKPQAAGKDSEAATADANDKAASQESSKETGGGKTKADSTKPSTGTKKPNTTSDKAAPAKEKGNPPAAAASAGHAQTDGPEDLSQISPSTLREAPGIDKLAQAGPSVKTNPSPRDALGIGNYLGCSSTNGY
ncbi:hypothetical protein CYK25_000465 [Varibaculum cambriense]|nr:hypothetical protein CYK25_000465 [Varibaculum cambriense]